MKVDISIFYRIMHKRVAICFLFFLFGMACVSGCTLSEKPGNPEQENTKENGIRKIIERGPVNVHLETDKSDMTIADRLNLTLSVIFDEDYDIELPGFGEKLEQFGIVDYHTSQPELTGNNQSTISRSYVLEPFLSGDYTIPSMTVRFRKNSETGDTWHEIETEEITVHVTSLLPENFEEMTIHDIMPPEYLPQSYGLWPWVGGIGFVLVISGVAVLIFIKKRKLNKNGSPIIHIPAHQQAFDELNALVAENLIEKGNIKEFYHKISDILRRYIENRFHIRAPELTTEEFLTGIQAKTNFDTAHKHLLRNFLTHCDLVKFARHEPQTEDIQQTFDSCKEFIIGTQEKE